MRSRDELPVAKTTVWPILRVFAIIIPILSFIAVTLVYLAKSQKPQHFNVYDQIYFSSTRDYQQIPFDMTDAMQYCQVKTEQKYGDSLALSYVDEHSTRLDNDNGLYKIFLVAHVGDLVNYQETSVHCFVDQYQHKMTLYRTTKIQDSDFIARAWSFFAN